MNISGIRPYAGFYEYNSIKMAEIRNQQITTSQEDLANGPDQRETENEIGAMAPMMEQSFTSYDFAQNYDPNASYELKGIDSDINDLDTMKAISDLDKDQVLRQYQYFVGDRKNVVAQTPLEPADRILRSGENFSL